MIELKVNGKKIAMNDYVQRVFENVLVALVSTLKGVDENWKEMEITLRILKKE